MDFIQSQTSKWWGAGLSVMDVFKMRNGRTLLLDLRYIHWNKGYNLSGQLLIRKALHLGQCYRNNFQCLRLRRVFEGHFWWEEPGARYIHLPPRLRASHWQTRVAQANRFLTSLAAMHGRFFQGREVKRAFFRELYATKIEYQVIKAIDSLAIYTMIWFKGFEEKSRDLAEIHI